MDQKNNNAIRKDSHFEISDSVKNFTVMDSTAKSTWWFYWYIAKKCALSLYGTENKIGLAEKTVIKCIKKGGMSTWSMPLFGQNGFVICPLFRTMAKFDYMTISTSSRSYGCQWTCLHSYRCQWTCNAQVLWHQAPWLLCNSPQSPPSPFFCFCFLSHLLLLLLCRSFSLLSYVIITASDTLLFCSSVFCSVLFLFCFVVLFCFILFCCCCCCDCMHVVLFIYICTYVFFCFFLFFSFSFFFVLYTIA